MHKVRFKEGEKWVYKPHLDDQVTHPLFPVTCTAFSSFFLPLFYSIIFVCFCLSFFVCQIFFFPVYLFLLSNCLSPLLGLLQIIKSIGAATLLSLVFPRLTQKYLIEHQPLAGFHWGSSYHTILHLLRLRLKCVWIHKGQTFLFEIVVYFRSHYLLALGFYFCWFIKDKGISHVSCLSPNVKHETCVEKSRKGRISYF